MDKHYLFILLYLCRFQAIYSNSNECVDVLLRSGARVDHKAAYCAKHKSEETKGKIGDTALDQVRFSSLI